MRASVFIVFTLFLSFLFFKQRAPSFPHCKDSYHPTLKDIQRMQVYLEKGKRPNLEQLKDFKGRAQLKLIGKTDHGLPQVGVIAVNCDTNQRKNCLLLYSTFNKNYPEGVKRLIERIQHSDYCGHILYRIGGWPNCEEGDFALASVPYAFKVCLFREAERLGYQCCLWLDSSITPLLSLNEIFSKIEKEDYLAIGNSFMVAPFFNEKSAQFFHLSMEQIAQIPSCSSGILGLNLGSEKACEVLEKWHQAAQDPHAFFSARPDQNSLSIILYQLQLTSWLTLNRLAHGKEQINEQSLFLLEREFVQDIPKSERKIY